MRRCAFYRRGAVPPLYSTSWPLQWALCNLFDVIQPFFSFLSFKEKITIIYYLFSLISPTERTRIRYISVVSVFVVEL